MANIFDLFKQIAKDEPASKGPVEYLVVGLGNPGLQYEKTRHNAGFLAIDFLAERHGIRVNNAKFKALVGDGMIGGKRVLLMKPQTYMNHSGEAVSEATRFYKLTAEKVIVLSDDTMLDPGRLRVRRKGSAGGHNGLKSLQEHLGTDEYARIRIGVGAKPSPDYDMADWVLSSLGEENLLKVKGTFSSLSMGLEKILGGDIDGAMQICNGK
ncbi:MAG: aminoacyl-tRNA hydrolase [Clostridia bacterium]|nr:aminoacyl-tRNA hydrolase [Clostridia bacterium]